MSVYGLIEEFLSATAQSRELWDHAITRTVAVRREDKWFAIATLCRLHLRGAARISRPRFLPATRHVLAVEEFIPMELFQQFLNDVARGEHCINDRSISFVRGLVWPNTSNSAGVADPPRPDAFMSGSFQRSTQLIVPSVPRPLVNAHHLGFHGDSSRTMIQWADTRVDSLDNELRALAHPWDGMTHLIRGTVASLHEWTPDSNVSFDVVAPLGVALNIDRCELKRDRLRISICAATPKAIHLASVGFGGQDMRGAPINGAAKASRSKWRKSDDLWYYEADVPTKDAKRVAIFLRLRNVAIQRVELDAAERKPNVLRAAHSLHNPKSDQAWVKILLETRGTDAHEFERAAARLFAMLDLSVDFLGDEDDTNAADALIRFGRDHLLVLECTTSTLKGNGKLAKLVSRTTRIRDGLRSSGIEVNEGYRAPVDRALMHLSGRKVHNDVSVVPVILSALPFNEISKGEVDDAQADGVVVLSRDDLRYFLECLQADDDYHDIVAGILTGRLRFPLADKWSLGS